MFKNDVRYRDNIAHVETIPAKKASFKKVDDLNEKIDTAKEDCIEVLENVQDFLAQ